MNDLVVRKLNPARQETWRYEGRTLRQSADSILIEAFFNRDDMLFHGILFGRNDRFLEIYYTNRWYNIFEIHAREDDAIRGWYCNISLPAEISEHEIAFVDLALDLLVFPDGQQLVLDEDEFEALVINADTRRQARAALEDLRRLFNQPGGVRLLF